jgi:hypothetical protein
MFSVVLDGRNRWLGRQENLKWSDVNTGSDPHIPPCPMGIVWTAPTPAIRIGFNLDFCVSIRHGSPWPKPYNPSRSTYLQQVFQSYVSYTRLPQWTRNIALMKW